MNIFSFHCIHLEHCVAEFKLPQQNVVENVCHIEIIW